MFFPPVSAGWPSSEGRATYLCAMRFCGARSAYFVQLSPPYLTPHHTAAALLRLHVSFAEGGYVAGRRNLVRAAANRLGAPGVAGGATLGQNQNLYQVRLLWSR